MRMQALFLIAIVLGVARLVFLAVLALWHRMRAPGREPPMLDPDTGPLISVLIPCFNEEKVIVASVRAHPALALEAPGGAGA